MTKGAGGVPLRSNTERGDYQKENDLYFVSFRLKTFSSLTDGIVGIAEYVLLDYFQFHGILL